MDQNKVLPVACLALPLTDERLAAYRQLTADLPPSPVKDAMAACLAAVAAWWQLPESSRRAVQWHVTHQGRQAAVPLTPLEDAHIAALWDQVPWGYELDAMERLLNTIQADEAQRNGEALARWREQIRELLLRQRLTAAELAWTRSPQARMLRTVLSALARFGDAATPHIAPLIGAFAPAGYTATTLREIREKVAAVTDEVAAIDRGEQPAPIPEPQLADTALRDAALTLLWYARELTLDREPLTADKL